MRQVRYAQQTCLVWSEFSGVLLICARLASPSSPVCSLRFLECIWSPVGLCELILESSRLWALWRLNHDRGQVLVWEFLFGSHSPRPLVPCSVLQLCTWTSINSFVSYPSNSLLLICWSLVKQKTYHGCHAKQGASIRLIHWSLFGCKIHHFFPVGC